MTGAIAVSVVSVVILLAVAAATWERRRASGRRGRAAGPHGGDTLFVVCLPEQQRDLTRDLVARLAPSGRLAPGNVRNAALELMRAMIDATHAYAGPVASQLPMAACGRLPGAARGVILALRVRGGWPAANGHGPGGAADIRDALRTLADAGALAAWLTAHSATEASHGPELVPLGANRPGHRPCAYCGAAMHVSDLRCEQCDARVQER